MLKVGIVGLPNVGKSTLFNALLKKHVAHTANYPFATIDPNIGAVDVPDARLPILANIVKTDRIVPASVKFFDIAGLVAGAHKGEGLGNQFLSHIRETSVIVHVVRLFEDSGILHVDDKPDPKGNIETIQSELILADLATLQKQRRPNKKLSKEDSLFYDTVDILKEKLDKGTPANSIKLAKKQQKAVKPLSLLTSKPTIFVFNVSESQLANREKTQSEINRILPSNNHAPQVLLSAKLESEIASLEDRDQIAYLNQYGSDESGLEHLIKKAYETLALISFLTAGEKEVRAWTITKGAKAPQA
ncbi:MAG: redox-regulated ATPase YchF, partial [Candidatus Paceibacterota bacterium]